METIKSHTDISQSKKLAKILPLESADMIYTMVNGYHTPFIRIETIKEMYEDDVLCWSLAALYHILPNTEYISTTLSRGGWEIEQPEYVDKWWCEYEDENDHTRDIIINADNPVDACVAMIENLHKLKIL